MQNFKKSVTKMMILKKCFCNSTLTRLLTSNNINKTCYPLPRFMGRVVLKRWGNDSSWLQLPPVFHPKSQIQHWFFPVLSFANCLNLVLSFSVFYLFLCCFFFINNKKWWQKAPPHCSHLKRKNLFEFLSFLLDSTNSIIKQRWQWQKLKTKNVNIFHIMEKGIYIYI